MAYVYRITHKESGRFYIGYNKGRKRIGIDYFTSSQYVEYDEKTAHEWDAEILLEADDEDFIWREEQRLIQKHIHNPLIINRQYFIGDRRVITEMNTEWHQQRYKDEEERRKQSERITEAYADSDLAERHSNSMKEKWKDPEYAAEMTAKLRAAHAKRRGFKASEETKRKMSDAQKRKWAERKNK